MIILHEPAFAKVNLTLDVLGKRPDGYHDLRSIMQTVSIRDDVTLTLGTGQPWKLTCNWEELPQGPDDLAWPSNQAAWDYYNNLLNQIYTAVAIGGNPEPISEDLVPVSPDKEIMDAAAQGVANWLYAFESVESGYLDHLYALLKDSQYIMENVTFE